tara:strand:- start:351 stop:548 length:198 start_codon:yes stop_codon:yes gene_type:complete
MIKEPNKEIIKTVVSSVLFVFDMKKKKILIKYITKKMIKEAKRIAYRRPFLSFAFLYSKVSLKNS